MCVMPSLALTSNLAGAVHAQEQSYLFDADFDYVIPSLSDADLAVQRDMLDAVAQFAKTG